MTPAMRWTRSALGDQLLQPLVGNVSVDPDEVPAPCVGQRRVQVAAAEFERHHLRRCALVDAAQEGERPLQVAHVVWTIRTLQPAWWEILSGTLPSRKRRLPAMPLLPTTIRSASCSCASVQDRGRRRRPCARRPRTPSRRCDKRRRPGPGSPARPRRVSGPGRSVGAGPVPATRVHPRERRVRAHDVETGAQPPGQLGGLANALSWPSRSRRCRRRSRMIMASAHLLQEGADLAARPAAARPPSGSGRRPSAPPGARPESASGSGSRRRPARTGRSHPRAISTGTPSAASLPL